MIIPHDKLSDEALRAVIEEYATRDGTELTDMDVKLAQIRRGLDAGRLVVTWDEESETCNIVRAEDVRDDDEA